MLFGERIQCRKDNLLLAQSLKVGSTRNHKTNSGMTVWITINTDVLHKRVGLQLGLHLAQGDIFT